MGAEPARVVASPPWHGGGPGDGDTLLLAQHVALSSAKGWDVLPTHGRGGRSPAGKTIPAALELGSASGVRRAGDPHPQLGAARSGCGIPPRVRPRGGGALRSHGVSFPRNLNSGFPGFVLL